MKKLNDLTKHLLVKELTNTGDPVITSLEMDSREVEKGSLFFCIKGYTVDGHDFARQAEERGAAALVAERPVNVNIPVVLVKDVKKAMAVMSNVFYDFPTNSFQLVGITGTNGKTTTSHLVEAMFRRASKKTGLVGTMYTKIGDRETEAKNTTPESLVLQKLFMEMREKQVEACAMEVSSHALDLGRTHGCDFNTAVFTNLTKDHLDYHHTMEAYKQAKSLLFSQLGNTYDGNRKTAVLNADDSASKDFMRMTAAQVLTYGIETECDIRAKNVVITPTETTFTLTTPWEERLVTMSLIGKFSVYNALAAAAACLAEGVSIDVIVETLEETKGVAGRFESVDAGQDFAVIVDYAHTPDSLENVLETIQGITEGRVITVVGCGGDRDATKRPEMANIAIQYSNHSIFTSDNPRTEDPQKILGDMTTGLQEKGSYQVIVDRREAIRKAVKEAGDGDVVLIAGKGHETYQDVGDKVLDFDDREEARQAIQMLKEL
ncbi:UDP-N-acetylmuramoyl-L-alanyl-D-glutamate--2,6-diaminopimelate ligase [Alteribacillus iranensis]|uniref:UDP-N-acetylmuramoyl-L-alanyl-D-glutamate--2,6-diaminopimelate ligase n=1 Tax=Alteribacillus iranensis TaxID=930128 RepID=A0A1I2ABR3_9BACI|nr:UDP-N-acetylmuramoyl-L-alanyl-D-glutamate--2,6-diaminopimelate ligase [Alteribacillus iranensis]SFE40998.1 UDP-N-acetylmuramoylalanyl-D-glutamate--2,6-diaminopimelate ligase [Alteribacillus iranensis]